MTNRQTNHCKALLILLIIVLSTACNETPQDTDIVTPERAPLRALTPVEYNHTVADLLELPWDGKLWPQPHPLAETFAPMMGDTAVIFGGQIYRPWPWHFPAEVGVDAFESMADGQVPSPYLIEELQKAAFHFASYALVSPTFFVCDNYDSLNDDEALACASDSIMKFAQRAWRRPMDLESRMELEAFWATSLEDTPIEAAIMLTIAGILQSPAFLYHLEVGVESDTNAPRRLSGFGSQPTLVLLVGYDARRRTVSCR